MPGQFAPVFTSSAPRPLPQFSQAVAYNGLVYCSGNIGIKPGSGFELVGGTAKDRTVSKVATALELSEPFNLCLPLRSASSDLRDWRLTPNTILLSQRQILTNIHTILQAAGSGLDNVLKMNIFLTDMDDFGIINEAYDEFFTQGIKPARTCVAVYQLPFGTDVEIECIAHLERQ
ncbi:hypothetical protein ASPVEDRAFT_41496 [Aspergillus versicolor CBS 583.65]|uniref:Uncharacterized protein n=1 Tax=Aspergillus versicolor CBS 583.65 TaxID=1036611 RepID=A0A1L9PK95_ASPVE|nr:uncharacterized protein ASPVEDRAFT_41496 [Aspergillus versicolor CBS 583.65]OJJ01957.1 hypothetical protein ASPVEDRAFT_41496 [Aspergillus versicolor CBS 583.65]